MSLGSLFTDHPASVGESYGEHMGTAFSFGVPMILAGFACLAHGFLPFLFKKTGSDTIRALHERMVTHRVKPHNTDRAAAYHAPAE
jgi:hypothetical protein